MKGFYITLCLIHVFCRCYSQKSQIDVVKEFYSALNKSDYGLVQKLISKTITLTEGDFVMPYTQTSYYTHFQWDSVFKPHYTILEVDTLTNVVIVTVSCTSERFKYLGNNPLVSKNKITFRDNCIFMIETIDYMGNDFLIWQSRRDSLVKWIDENHKDLSGFINDLTKTGAENYMSAIRLYLN